MAINVFFDGSHLPIKCPSGGQEAKKQQYNFKNFCSVVLLGLVDANYRFIWASLGALGNTHDSAYFESTSLWDDITSGKTLPGQVVQVNGVETPPIILDSSSMDDETTRECCINTGDSLF